MVGVKDSVLHHLLSQCVLQYAKATRDLVPVFCGALQGAVQSLGALQGS